MRVLIIGCGYIGRRAAARWIAAGHEVTALTRSPERAAELARAGLRTVVGDVLDTRSLAALPAADVLLYAVGYDRTAGQDKRTVYVEGLRQVLHAVQERVGRCIYVSSSSVYGQDAGEWVDETSPTEPQTEGGRICLAAEEVVLRSPLGLADRSCILRLSGIYGPDRLLAKVDALRQGTPLAGSPEAWLNLIHVDDAAAAASAAAESPAPQPLYLVSDDRPVTRGEYYAQLASLVSAPTPRFDPTQSPRHGTGLNKRCCAQLVKDSLGMEWNYPTLAEGLPACLAGR